jgi:hypothetical protein
MELFRAFQLGVVSESLQCDFADLYGVKWSKGRKQDTARGLLQRFGESRKCVRTSVPISSSTAD